MMQRISGRALPLVVACAAAVLAAPRPARARRRAGPAPRQQMLLDGALVPVHWSDGDSFQIKGGAGKGRRARLADVNTLESYGPVHLWGGFSAAQLYRLAKRATAAARGKQWTCKTLGGEGGYGRALVRCPGLAAALVRDGLAHVFSVDRAPDAGLLALQAGAQASRRGIWRLGIPAAIVTSVHSTAEQKGKRKGKRKQKKQGQAYNRVCDTRSGRSRTVPHAVAFRTCDVWCHGGSCMIYIPYEQRYGRRGKDRPACLRRGRGRETRMTAPRHLRAPAAAAVQGEPRDE